MRNLIREWKGLHDLLLRLDPGDMLPRVVRKFGEGEVYAMLRAPRETGMMKRTWKGFRKMPVARTLRADERLDREEYREGEVRCGRRRLERSRPGRS